ncbi:MAG: hypothetical protein A3D74_00565 [Candidatus Levybacteria bacterium RIFCSPHIGHO2_02_FULL_37_13]|nr:MAG: hypothetical protein A3D74_00565 [Candidatus Levybacteria bacterium RIFCSPHIGHO2_02_FULL_37_13]OGH29993.1 MAG: hypothetical protein A3E40_00935 [Candidatus Levybacteria bacterium RIFCSPHIGHO2_12_FULL_37_9]OGH37860.1 MAG: hypothetical protein A3B41_01810 [Candidatus Levybacteria bacterium RIFCSPLOWO2_01_FULL_37_26]
MKIIPHNQPTLGKEEIEAVRKVLESNWLIGREEVKKLENSVKKSVNRNYAIATNSGTSALHLSLLVLGVKAKDEILLPTFTVSDILNAIYYVGARPILVDIEKNGFNLDIAKVKGKLNGKTKAILIPHAFGFPAKIDQLKKYKIPIIEDCAQALGSFYKGKPVGSFGDLSIFSFYATKMITSGQGGMVVTNNKEYYDTMKDLIDYNGRDNYKVRYNYPMTDIAASIVNVQFGKLRSFIEKRKYIASKYNKILENKKILFWPKREDAHINHFRFIIKFDSRVTRDKIKEKLARYGITTIIPIANYELLHNLLKQDRKYFQNAEKLANTTLSLPIFPNLSDVEIARIVEKLNKVL